MKEDDFLGNSPDADLVSESVTRKTELMHRLKRVRESLGKNQRDMDSALAIGKGSWQRYESGGQMPGSQVVAELARRGFNGHWILTGEGEMRQVAETSKRAEFTYIKQLKVYASGGDNQEAEYEAVTEDIAFRTAWLQKYGLNPAVLHIHTARGDTMAPTIGEGDTLLVNAYVKKDLTGNKLTFKEEAPPHLGDGIYIIRLDGHLVVRRLQGTGRGSVRIICDNPAYAAVELPREELEVAGKVEWVGRRL